VSDVKAAIKAVKLAELSLHPGKAPKYDRDKIEEARKEVSEGLLLAIKLLSDIK
jgi:hypothetical protein